MNTCIIEIEAHAIYRADGGHAVLTRVLPNGRWQLIEPDDADD